MSKSRMANVGTVSGGMFVRKSSGLVRTVSTLDTLFYCIVQLAIPYVMFNFAVYAFYPGASMELATILALIGSIAVGITYALFSAVYPRSGGEYVFLSRTAHPFIGFVASFVMSFWEIYYFGVNGAFAATIGIAPLFTIIGFQTNNAAFTSIGQFVDSPWGWFLVGVLMIAFFTVQLFQGMRTYFKVQKWALILAMIGYLVFILVLVLGSSGAFDFRGNYDTIAGAGAYDSLIATAKGEGAEIDVPYSSSQTLNFIIWPAFSFLFAVLSVSFSGEIKNVKRGQLYAIVGANLIGGAMILLTTYFGRMAIGDTFLKAASFMGAVDPLPYPWLTLLASVLGGNILLTAIINLTIAILIVYVAASTAIYATRGIFAWALDGMAPAKLAEVSEKYHTPTYSIIATAVVALGCLALYSFTDNVRVLSGIAPMGVVFGLVAFVGMIFPYIKRDVYETSPARIQVAGIPLMTITGFIGTIVTAFIIYRAFVDDTYAANSTFSIWMILTVFIISAVWYFVAREVRRRQGVDMDARYKEIPVE